MKKMWMVVVVITTFVATGCQEGLLTTGNVKVLALKDSIVKDILIGKWELIELTGGIGGNKWNFELPSPKTLKISELDEGLSFTYTDDSHDGLSARIGTMEYVFVESISMFDGKKHIMLGEKSIDGKVYSTILFEFRENGNYIVLDDNVADGFRSVYKRIR